MTARQPWHYDAIAGRPEWSKQLARENVLRRQQQNVDARRRQQKGKAA